MTPVHMTRLHNKGDLKGQILEIILGPVHFSKKKIKEKPLERKKNPLFVRSHLATEGGREKPPPVPSPCAAPPPNSALGRGQAFDSVNLATFQVGSIPRLSAAVGAVVVFSGLRVGQSVRISLFRRIWMEVTGVSGFVASSPCSVGLSGDVRLVYQNRNFFTTFPLLNFIVHMVRILFYFPGVKTFGTRG
jgi:hypothetical protein